jgi:hypothetical protein
LEHRLQCHRYFKKMHLFGWIFLALLSITSFVKAGVPLLNDEKNVPFEVALYSSPPAPLTVTITPVNPTTCPVWNLQITATPSGGTAPYTYLWTGSGAAYLDQINIYNPNFTACPVGDYTLTCTVTDNLGAQSSGTTTIHVVDAAPVFGSCLPNITKCGVQNISWENAVTDIHELICPSCVVCPYNGASMWVDNGPWVWQTFHAGKTGLMKSLTIGLLNCDHLPFTLHLKLFPGEPDSTVDPQYPNTCPIWEYDTVFTVAGGTADGVYTFIIPDNVAPYMQAGPNWYTLCMSGIGSYDINAWQHGWWLSASSCTAPVFPDPMPGGGTYGYYDYEGTQQPPGYYHTYHLAFNTVIAQIPGLTVTDGCSVKTLVSSIPSGSLFNIGTTPVTFTATNSGGNTSQCSFNVTINNTAVPNPPVSGGNKTACQGSPIPALTVTVDAGCTADWYSAPVGGALLLSGSLSYTPPGAGTYWAEARFTAGGCTSGTRTPVTLFIPTLLISNPAAVCSFGPVDLTDPSVTVGSSLCGGTLSYWTNPACTIPLASPNAVTVAGTYYIKLSNTVPVLCTVIQPVVVVFYPTPILIITNPAPVCSPNTVNITAASVTAGSSLTDATLSYWMDAAATIPLATPTAVAVSGTYYIKALTSDNCQDIKPVVVVINPLLPVSVSIAASANPVCTGTSVTFTATPTNGGTTPAYQWKLNGANVGTNSATYTLPAPVNGNVITCVLTSNATCPSGNPATSNAITMVVAAASPTFSTQPTSSTICVGNNTSFISVATGNGVTYQWQVNPGTGWTAVTNGGVYSGATTGTLTITGALLSMSTYQYRCLATDACGNKTSNVVTLTVNALDVITLTSAAGTDAQTVCINHAITNITYSTTGATGASFIGLPTGVGGAWASNVVTISGTPTVSGVFTYTITLIGGCPTTKTGTITVNPNNTIALTSAAGTDAQTVCINTAITNITYSTTGATGASYSGLPTGVTGAWAANVVTISGTPSVSGVFNYTITLTGGCGVITKTGTITVTANNTITLTSAAGTDNQTVCINTAITNITYSTTGATGASYSGLPTGVTGAWASNVVTISGTPSAAGVFNYTITLTGGCGVVTKTGTITVNATNTITLTSAAGTDNQTKCINTPITNITYSTTGATGASFAGLPAGVTGAWAASIVTISGTPSVSGIFNYTITLTGGCGVVTKTGTITVTANNTITLTSAAGTDNQTVCINTSITNITYSTTGATGASFAGLPAGVTGAWAASIVTISGTPSASGVFNYTITLTGGCGVITKTGTITVTANNTITLTSAGGTDAQTVCINTAITNITYSTTGATGATYSGLPTGVTGAWASNVVTISGTPSVAGTFSYTITLTGGCGNITKTGTITVTANNTITLTSAGGTDAQTVCINTAITNITYSTTGATGASYSGLPTGVSGAWASNVVTISGTPSVAGTFTYTITLTGGCGNITKTGTITVTANNTITLTSAGGTDAQTVCINHAITNITYSTTGATGATFSGLPTGVSGVWASNVVTISGTPSVAGTFSYTITLTGGCGNITKTGTITVTANNTITLTSAGGTDAQTVCINTAITNITYSTTGATGASYSGLPTGVSGAWASNVVTISGTPSVAGTFSYTITLTGGCGNITKTGTITVTANNTITLTSAGGTDAQTVCINHAITNITYSTTGATGATFSGLPVGVVGAWASNVVTISGTPSVAGTFSYTITLTGGCGNITKTGTITVTANNTITLTSAGGTDAQTVCINTAITNITYSTTGATGASYSGLPTGVSGAWASNVVTISGTPSVAGTFTYTITLTGGCGNITKTGTITVTANNTITLTSAGGTDAQTVCINTAITNITYSTTGATGATYSGLPTGVTGAWASNVVTISGTPSVAGTFPYTITLTGGCGNITKTGTITVTANNTITLTSAGGTDAQTVCINHAITNITYSTTGATGATFSGLPAGVVGAWASNVVTISGTPSVAGTFSYTITLTGGCGNITKTGTITVTANNTITLTSAAGTDNQTVCINTAITNITYSTTGATGASFAGLPAGVTGAWAASIVTITGTPSVSGVFNYTITLTGGCGVVTKTGTITVTPNNTITLTSAAGTDNQTVCINTAITNITYSTTGATGASFAGLPAGVTGAWAASIVTISGTPSVSGVFNYTITLTGGCGVVTKTGTITVTPNNTITLTSAAGTDNQTVCINTAITNITYSTTGATGASFAGLPAGVTGAWAASIVTISGTPSVSGVFNYTITLTGGCGVVTKTGTITVTPNNTITLTSAAGTDNQTVCINTAITNITYSTTGATGASFAGLPAGVTGAWAASIVTISGTPSVSGVFNYTITLTGGCGVVTKTGTITVTANNTITLTSAAGTDNQTVCINTAITNITYSTTGATGASFSGLPTGVGGAWASNVVTISGTPSVSGVFNYTITLTGGCGVVTKTGTITVTPNNTITLTSAAGTDNQTVCINTAITNITYSTTGATGASFSGLPTGVGGAWASNVVTISGTPTVSGVFNYTITLTGGCGVVTKTGTITVTPNNTITLTSAAGTDNQTVCINTAITNITYSTTGATGASFSGLPTGVGGAWASNVVTISGTPTVSGVFNYTITLTGGCGVVTKTGTITVTPNNTITLTSAAGTDNQTVCINTAITNITYSTTGATGASFAGLPAGVTGAWAASIVTITGTPSVSGVFNYTITLTGGCGVVTKTGTITVTPNNTITLTSAAGTDNQTVCINTAITNITYSTTGATGASFAGLPAGVTGAWAASIVTISGTPSVSGVFNYTITLTGGCGVVTKTGTITVTPNNTITLTSAAGTDNQTVCINTAITNITYSTTGATGASFAGLPAGVTGAWAASIVTISGTPSVSGVFNYTITLTGGCGVVTKTGTITVTPNNTITLTSAAGTDNQTVCINTAITNITYSTTGATGASFAGLPAGVTGAWAASIVTISGTPSVSGVFNYTITLTGGCGVVTKTGTITVTPNNTITLTSAAGTDNQTVCINTAITNITYSTTGATGASFAGLPAGVTGAWAASIVTISGTPSVSGVFNYTITLTGGCGVVTKTGTITVTPNNTITLTSAGGTDAQTVCINTAITNITYSTTGATGATYSGLPTGVTGAWASNVVTISGTPSVAGTFPYTITLTGGCGNITKTGTITVTANNTITLTSAGGTDAQTVCINHAITNITYSTTGATGATFSGLPTGVTGAWASNVVTISGTPSVAGTFPYTITLTGGCGNITKTGTITVTANNTITLTSAAGTDNQTVCINTAITNITYSTTGATGASFAGLPAGVTGAWAASIVTISGTPSVSGVFNYTITLTGGCGVVTKTGTITVTANNTITLTSAAGTDNQTVCINTAITNITYSTTGATGASFAGLPAGVTGAWAASIVTISGTPSVSGVFNYTITLTGGCGVVTKTGTITVTPNNTITLTSAAGTDNQTVCINTAITNITYSTTGATGASFAGLPAGVTGAWAASIVTITGTPSVSGVFNYTITLTGGCGVVTKTGTITVTPNNTITLTSAAGTDNQTVCINTAITNITYSTTGATGASFAGLPAGVTGAWAASIVTITGTPSVSGVFNYTITLTGGCGVVTKTGTITVTPNNTITLTSAAGTDNQTVCINTAITNITYSTTGATGASFAGLPAGVTGAWAASIVTISGTPSVSGVFNYTITLTGGCGVVTKTGTITVTPNNTITLTSAAGTDNQTVCINTAITNITYSTTGATGASFAGLPAGVTGAWAASIVTITGTPSVSGVFNYTITLTGGCGVVTKTGTITVTPNNTITLTSAAGTDNQTVCINTAITNITYSTTGATGASFAGLPAGVTGAWAASIVTISGTPSVSGVFNYTITLTGGCGVVTKTGTITVTPNNTITLTSAAGTDNQTVCINTAITNITYSTTGATGASFAGLPAGVTGAWAASIVTISGTPSVSGVFNYTITLTGGCGVVTKTGTITVTPNNTITLTSAAGTDNQTVCINTAITNITYSTTGATGASFAGLPAGVTGAWAASIVTISGTPSVSGVFNYTITLTGGCGVVTKTGTITVTPNNTITLTSAAGTDNQTVCINTAITNITYSTTGATGASFAGLPAGVTGAWAASIVTISGTPSVSGVFNYTITLTGGCGVVTKTGTITVTPNNTITLTSAAGTDNQTVCINTAITNITYSTTGATGASFAGLPAGVTGAWAASIVTISGTPSVSGVFNYTITLTGGCGVVTKTGTITVTPNNTITLTSAAGTDNQTVCINTAITNITYSTTGATGASFAGLPAGVTGAWAASIVTISGTPSVSGVFNYTITLTGGCGVVTKTGTITVTPNNTITLTSAAGTDNQTVCINTAITNITYSTTGATGASFAGLPAGVTGAWAASIVTISGTPSVSGVFNYTITLTGGCGVVTKTGTITVTPNNTITLTSAAGTDNQTVCINTAITNITYSTTGATGASFAGLPAGVTGAWAASIVTISGTPSVSGVFNYTITLTGGCGVVTKTGTITVTPNNTITLTSAAGTDNQTVCINTAITNITYSTTGATGASFAGLPAGVTGAWAASIVTISGTPSVSGVFNYTITLTGGCGVVTKTGTITVTPNNTITLTSAAGTDNQTVCINTAITNITYSTTGATGASFAGLPAGVTGAWAASIVTISGTPSVSGVFNYTITLTGGCGVVTKTGTITVTPNNTITLTSAAGTDNQTVCINTAITNITYSTTGATGASFAGLPAGVTGAWAASIVTISGTPSVSGVFNYTITLTGGCGVVTKTGTITVTPNNTITLTSAAGTDNQTVCINTAITNITYSTTGATGATYSGLPTGVTGAWASNVVTISGTPSVSGVFNYTITLTGGCGVVTKTGTITVTPNNTITLTSAAGTDNQTVCINTAITNITYSTTGATGASFAGLPAGVTGAWAASIVTITGTPSVSGVFNYTITLTGGCGVVTKTGTITVTPNNTITLTSAAGTDNQTVCINTAITNITYSTTGATGASFAGLPAGVTGAWAASIVTISGTPSVSGVFNYTITLTGGCGVVTKTGTITVTPNNTITLTSAAGTDNQTVCINTAITNITYSTTGATGASFAGLPAGVTGAWAASIVTISGTPSVSGVFNYTITLTGGCGVVTKTGTITVTPNNTITLTSAAGTDNQTVCINTAITNITYSTTGATGASFAGLPAGVTGAWASNVVTISGTPSVSGVFNYTITLTGGCGVVTKTGTITVTPNNTITLTSAAGTDNQTVCINTAITNITYSTTGATGASFAGLPAGVTGAWAASIVTITGTPSVSGVFNYTITLTGGCGVVTKTGTITVTPNNTITLTSAAGTDNQTVCINTAITNITYSTTGATGASFVGLPAGVTGAWAASIVTISGTPSVSGVFNYTITLTGGCGVVTKTGTITVTPNNTITLTSAAGTDNQTVCINTAITNITYSTTGATGASFAGLPAGVTGAWAASIVTISGTPSVSGVFNYTITLTGGCGVVTKTGTITVTPNNTITLTSAAGTDNQTVCINTAITNITYSTTGATGASFAGLPAGVTGAWAASIVTISGTPSVSGVFNYTITLTGGCGVVTKTGTITVTPNNTITLTSAAGTDNQTVCINTAITNITYSTTGATGATYSGLPTGVTGAWASNVVTISGTPSVSGVFNYTITLTGGCGVVTKTGTITVTPNNTITLTSAAGTDNQTVCINTAITNITYSTTGATGASFAGLPAGVTGAWAASIVTITGTPSVSGVFNYTITLTGGCGVVTKTGTITVTPNNTITLTSAAGTDNQTVCINTAITNITYSTTGATGASFAGLPAGVTGAWASNVVTISGTPSVSGVFNYTITLTGGCGVVTKTGTITVTPNNTITLTSAAGTDNQTVCINTAITNITYSTTGATGASFAGLPAGVTGAWAASIVTITGTPSVSGVFNYTITLTGGCGVVTKTGTITVTPNNTITLTSAAGTDNQTVCINTAITNITYSTTGATGASFAGLPAGVTGAWAASIVTITGTPSVSGVFNYTITLTGGCGVVTKTGTITVTANNIITLTSAAGTDNQTVCINTAITNITYSTTGATGASFAGLPAGVTGAWAASIVTISGTPSVSGVFNYTITLTGGCGVVTKTGTITVTPNNTITLTSAAGTDNQTVCINTAITNITYSTTGATGASFAGLPAGVTGAWAASIVTISGTPSVSGVFNYTITLTGGCGVVTKTGTITVTANNTITLTSAAGTDNQTVCINTAITNITYSTTGATGASFAGLPAGVTGAWAASIVTITGTPSVSGVFNYTITLTGGCGVVTKTGTITVTPNNTITLTSAAGTDNQTVCINTAITNITYSTTGATGASFAGLPAGVTGAWAASIVTISGTPSVSGVFNYTITLTGGCGVVTKTGTITVTPNNTITLTSAAGTDNQTVCINTAITNITYSTTGATGASFAGLPAGVTGAWAASIVTISGTPSVSGVFNYTITLTGGCGVVTKTGTITVTPNNTITLTSAAGTDNQTVCINTAITNITYSTTGATGASFAGLPAGVTGAWAASIVTISGTPSVSGVFNYTITLTGGCGVVTKTGTITVTPNNTITLTSAAGTDNQTVCINTAITNITYSTTGATGASFAGLPAGVTGAWAASIVTISGTPSVSGTFTYTITLTGGCGNITTTGTIKVNPRPVPTISGPTPVCANSTGNIYTTQAGMIDYNWIVSSGGTVTAGGSNTSNSITITWNTIGLQTVSVSYIDTNGCKAVNPAVFNVTVNPLPLTSPIYHY